MARRKTPEKKAWEWALKTDPESVQWAHVSQAYRVNTKACVPGTCRKNCRWNPNCLLHLGESQWLSPPGSDEEQDDIEDQVRAEGEFAGLRNLGATCYVNALLQVWYHNPIFRWAIFRYEGAVYPDPDAKDSNTSSTEPTSSCNEGSAPPTKKQKLDSFRKTEEEPEPPSPLLSSMKSQDEASSSSCERMEEGDTRPIVVREEASAPDMPSVLGLLQLLFAKLQYSTRSSIDPVDFINSLSLQHSQQQDAQEFLKLFLSLLESAFQCQSPDLQHVIQNQFSGTYAYVTRCEGCKAVSAMDSQYYELELSIKGHKMLQDCLNEFFQQESLSDENKYFCSRCKCKQDAKRFIRLKTLPPILTLQLMRFVFNMSLLAKVKVASYLIFPDTLDMSPYTGGDSSVVYQLRAVIVHCGPSAYSGHYIAHVKDTKSDSWYRFDDDIVEKMKGDKLVLGSQDDLYGMASSSKKPKCPKNHHMSNNAYMLVYTRTGAFTGIPDPVAPPSLQEVVAADNSIFEQLISESRAIKADTQSMMRAKQREMERLYRGLAVKPGVEAYDWMRTSWLQKWLCKEQLGRCEHEDLLCEHSKISPDKIVELKRVSSDVACELYGQYSQESLRLTSDMLCKECVVQRCRELQTDDRLASDQKTITFLLKTPCTSSSGFWVGKKSLQCWKKLYLTRDRGGSASKSTEVKSTTESTAVVPVEGERTGLVSVETRCAGGCSVSSGGTSKGGACDSSVIVVSSNGEGSQPSSTSRRRLRRSSTLSVKKLDSQELCRDGLSMRAPLLTSSDSKSPNTLTNDSTKQAPNATRTHASDQRLHEQSDSSQRGNEGSAPDQSVEVDSTSTCPLDRLEPASVAPHVCGCTDIDKRSGSEKSRRAGCWCGAREAGNDEEDKSVSMKFNSDLLCKHGRLCENERLRKLVPPKVWQLLQGYFPDSQSFTALHSPCVLCRQARLEEEEQTEVLKSVAQAQKTQLPDLYHGRSRPHPSEAVSKVFVVPSDFVDDWTAFLRYPGRYEQPRSLKMSSLLCEHGEFPFNVTMETYSDFGAHLAYLWPSEWSTLLQWYPSDAQVSLTCTHSEDGAALIESTPPCCTECHQQRVALEASAHDNDEETSTGYLYVYQSEVDMETAGTSREQLPNVAEMMTMPTRSLRRRIPVGAKKIKMSVNQTLKTLQLDIMCQFQVSPSDQQLYLNGCKLDSEEKTLSELSICPGSTILLKVDSEEDVLERFIRATAASSKDEVEGGFKGTGLLH